MIGDLLGARPRVGSWEHTHGWPRAAGGLGERVDRKGEQALQGEEPAELGECWGAEPPRGENGKAGAGGHAGSPQVGVPEPSALQTGYAEVGGAA